MTVRSVVGAALSRVLGMAAQTKTEVDKLKGEITQVFAAPLTMTPVVGTAAQALDPTRPALLTINVMITQNLTLAGTLTDVMELRIGPDKAGVEAGTSGVALDEAGQSLTGIAVSIGMGNSMRLPMKAFLPAGWWYAIRRVQGQASRQQITSAFQQAVM